MKTKMSKAVETLSGLSKVFILTVLSVIVLISMHLLATAAPKHNVVTTPPPDNILNFERCEILEETGTDYLVVRCFAIYPYGQKSEVLLRAGYDSNGDLQPVNVVPYLIHVPYPEEGNENDD